MFEWCARFRSGRQSVGDDVRARALRTAITDQNISQVETCILVDRRVTVREIEKELSLSVGSVETIIHERLEIIQSICQMGLKATDRRTQATAN